MSEATVLQVGEGRFLRGFLGVMIDEARREGRFRARVVVTAPRPTGAPALALLREAGGYLVTVRGPDGERRTRPAPYDAVVDGFADWQRLLDEAAAERPLVVVSNTTEAGLAYRPDDAGSPRSFPARLTAWLAERRRRGVRQPAAIIPCELIADNGPVLRASVVRHAADWGLDGEALVADVPFADTLVDRIVTSEDPSDPLACVTEPYIAWFIAGMPRWVREVLPLDERHVHWVDDVTPARDRKLRLLNGTHTLMAALGLQMGVETVRQALSHRDLGRWVTAAVRGEGVDSFAEDVRTEAATFAEETLRRFENPGIEHVLSRIALQMTAKVGARWTPILRSYRDAHARWPERYAAGVAAYLRLAADPDAGFDLAGVDDAACIGRLRGLWRDTGGGAGFVAAAADVPGFPAPVEPALLQAVAGHLEAMSGGVGGFLARWGSARPAAPGRS